MLRNDWRRPVPCTTLLSTGGDIGLGRLRRSEQATGLTVGNRITDAAGCHGPVQRSHTEE